MKTKKTKKHGHTYWHRKLDKLLGEWMRDKYTECAMCHKPSQFLQVSHILPKGRYQGLRYDPINILPMDGGCHEYRWHSNPIESHEWFKQHYPERYTYLQEAKNIFIKRDEQYYLKVKRALEEKKPRDLMILNLPLDNKE
jgi:hypothetical protein